MLEPSTAQLREIRQELEQYDIREIFSGRKLIPTNFAEKICLYFFDIKEDEFFRLGEGEITKLCSEAVVKIFGADTLQKKS